MTKTNEMSQSGGGQHNANTMRHWYRGDNVITIHLFVGENTKKLLAFGIGGVWLGMFNSDTRRGLAVTSCPSSSDSPPSSKNT